MGEGGLSAGIIKTLLQTASDAEMVEHWGYDKGEALQSIGPQGHDVLAERA